MLWTWSKKDEQMVKIKAKDLDHDLAPFDHPHNCVIGLLYDDTLFMDRSIRPLTGNFRAIWNKHKKNLK